MGCIPRSPRSAGSVRVIALGEKGLPGVGERLDLEPECYRNLVPDIERGAVPTVDIIVSTELKGPAELSRHPLGRTMNNTIITVAA